MDHATRNEQKQKGATDPFTGGWHQRFVCVFGVIGARIGSAA